MTKWHPSNLPSWNDALCDACRPGNSTKRSRHFGVGCSSEFSTATSCRRSKAEPPWFTTSCGASRWRKCTLSRHSHRRRRIWPKARTVRHFEWWTKWNGFDDWLDSFSPHIVVACLEQVADLVDGWLDFDVVVSGICFHLLVVVFLIVFVLWSFVAWFVVCFWFSCFLFVSFVLVSFDFIINSVILKLLTKSISVKCTDFLFFQKKIYLSLWWLYVKPEANEIIVTLRFVCQIEPSPEYLIKRTNLYKVFTYYPTTQDVIESSVRDQEIVLNDFL